MFLFAPMCSSACGIYFKNCVSGQKLIVSSIHLIRTVKTITWCNFNHSIRKHQYIWITISFGLLCRVLLLSKNKRSLKQSVRGNCIFAQFPCILVIYAIKMRIKQERKNLSTNWTGFLHILLSRRVHSWPIACLV